MVGCDLVSQYYPLCRFTSEKTRIWLLIRQTAIGEKQTSPATPNSISLIPLIDRQFTEDNPIEVLIWSLDKDYATVCARIERIKSKAPGEEEIFMTENDKQELGNNVGVGLVMAGR